MKAKLFVRGAGVDPIELEIEEAEAAQKLIGDATKPKETPFSIEGVWSGTKADMKFVVFPKKEEEHKDTHVVPFTKSEAEEFDKEFQPFREKAKTEGLKSYDAIPLWLESLGLMRITRWEAKEGRPPFITTAIPMSRIPEYQAALDRKDRRDAYYEKVAYAKKKENDELERMAAQIGQDMTVPPAP